MQVLDEIEAIDGRGLRGDRYLERTGYWTAVDECQVTLIQAEDLDEITRTTPLHVPIRTPQKPNPAALNSMLLLRGEC